jgi:uncharacterized protein
MKTWISYIIAKRVWVVAVCALLTLGLMSQLKNLSVVLTSDNMLPQSNHYIRTANELESTFGKKNVVVVAVTAKTGTIYQGPILAKVGNITRRLMSAPGIIKSNVNSLSTRKSKAIQGTSEGMIVRPLMERVPETPEEMDALSAGVASNPVYENLLVSKDQKTTQIIAEFKENPKGFKALEESVRAAVDPESDGTVDIAVSGLPIFLSWLEKFAGRMGFLMPLAILIVGIIHYEAFRTLQALILPLITALLAVIWSLAFLAISGRPMDVFNASTPILILAIAAGHAVQILKRYYEEYAKLREALPHEDPKRRNRQAVLNTLVRVGPVMIVACIVAALGFFSLVIFEIKAIRTFGLMTGAGIFSALILELTFIPALRAILPPPGDRETRREKEVTFWDRFIGRIFTLVTRRRKAVYITAFIITAALSLGGHWLKIENSQKGYFYGKLQIRQDDDFINAKMAGANALFMLVDAGQVDGIKNPRILTAMEKVQEHLQSDPRIGKSVSLVDFIKRMNQAMNADDPGFSRIPANRDLVAQYLLLYSNSGDPEDFDSYVDYNYQKADIQIFSKTDNSIELADIVKQTEAYAKTVFPPGVRIEMGGGSVSSLALNEEMIRSKALNILQILGCVFLISSLIFRSILAGSLILVPLVATVFVNFGVMGLLGIPLNIPTSLVSAMAVGIGADYAIYLSFRLREELRRQADESNAIRTAFFSAGKAAVFVSTAVAGGFGVLIFSAGFNMHVWMGFLIALAMLVSSMSTLTVFASLLLTLRPAFIFKYAATPQLSKENAL